MLSIIAVSRSIVAVPRLLQAGARVAERCLAERKSVMQCRRELHRIAVSEHVHVEGCRLRSQQMIVERRDLDAAFGELGHHRAISASVSTRSPITMVALPSGPEGEPGAEREARLQLDAIKRDMQIGARQADAINAARHCCAGFAERASDLAPVDFGGGGGEGSEADHTRECGGASNAHDTWLMNAGKDGSTSIRFICHSSCCQCLLTRVACRYSVLQAFAPRAGRSPPVPVQESASRSSH